MFYGQIMQQGYLKDPSISFVGVGDIYSDKGPLQVCEFAQGTTIDDWIKKIWLEKGGGSGWYESYEFAAYYYLKCCNVPPNTKGFFFFTGDEGFWPTIPKAKIKELIGLDEQADVNSPDVFKELRKKFHVFLLHKRYSDSSTEVKIKEQWSSVIGGEHVLELTDPKACIDVMLGAISVVSGARSLDKYMADMKERGQTEDRLKEVETALKNLHT
eukprot:TRINITY_DN751_c0_g1_i1.p1 TRINITY_DN751_c0_g1~~TRINITY_DN751_c0_g1_i1.p1  ORF type:complete len:214 (+),score=62.34 TRINITY_DN751_c0_g1_i1:31-672(+)